MNTPQTHYVPLGSTKLSATDPPASSLIAQAVSNVSNTVLAAIDQLESVAKDLHGMAEMLSCQAQALRQVLNGQ